MDSDTKTAIDEYYKLKNEYETKIDKLRKKIRNDKSLSKEEKRRKMLEIVPKCEQILKQQSPIHHHQPSGGR